MRSLMSNNFKVEHEEDLIGSAEKNLGALVDHKFCMSQPRDVAILKVHVI